MSAAIELEADVSDPLAAALLEIASLHERLAKAEAERNSAQQDVTFYEGYISKQHADLQRLIHERDALREQLGAEVRVAKTGGYELEVHCDTRDCETPPLRIRSAPPEDAVPQWIRGCGWFVDADRHLCPKCGGGK